MTLLAWQAWIACTARPGPCVSVCEGKSEKAQPCRKGCCSHMPVSALFAGSIDPASRRYGGMPRLLIGQNLPDSLLEGFHGLSAGH